MGDIVNPMDLRGRNVIVTGASSGLGREISIVLADLGARLVLVGRNIERLSETSRSLAGEGHVIEALDLTSVDELPAWMKDVSARIGPLNGVVHAAGAQITLPLRDLRREHIESLMTIHATASLFLAKAFRQPGVGAAGGSIVFIASVRALVGDAGIAAYAASKGAVLALTKSLAIELARQRIRVNCIAAAYVSTELMADAAERSVGAEALTALERAHPLGFGTPRDVANSAAFLLSDTGRWITGSTLVVDGGFTAR
ncbi:MAG TPA: SDR family oxidoreductase [Armatimonadota bacterium]|nr:SDR family oxidoreductase [Armatimonadota bacterium]